jgi:hypothetical protein
LYHDDYEFIEYIKLEAGDYQYEENVPNLVRTGSDLEANYIKLVTLAHKLFHKIRNGTVDIDMDSLINDMAEAKEENPDLVSTKYWRAFEGYIYLKWFKHIVIWSNDYMPKPDFNLFREYLDFAEEQKFEECFKKYGETLAHKVFKHTVRGKISMDKGLSYLDMLLPRVINYEEIATFTRYRPEWIPRHKDRLVAVQDHIFKFTLQHRPKYFRLFFDSFLKNFCDILGQAKGEDVLNGRLHVIKRVLKWREHLDVFKIQGKALRERLIPATILDKEIQKIIYPKGLLFTSEVCEVMEKYLQNSKLGLESDAFEKYLESCERCPETVNYIYERK